MKHFLRALMLFMAALPACAFTPNTSTGVFSAVSRRPQPDFQWTWSAQNSQAINVEFQQAVGVTSVLFRLSSPERGPYYLQVNNGVITPGPTSVVWQTLLPINPNNVPPAQTLPYFAEFLGFGSNNVQKTLAAGRVAVVWSIFNGTNAASFQTANIVYTNVGSFVVSFPSQSVETNHLGATTMALFGSETASRVGADAALSNRIAGTSNTLSAAVSAETAARVAADAALSNALTTVSNAAVALVAAEITARTNGDASVLAQLTATSNSLHAVDVSLSNQIAALSGGGTSVVQETAARIAADAALSNNINTVSNALAAADADTWGKFTAASNSLSTRIDAETAARITAVAGVSNALATASNSLSTRIDAEVAARVTAVAGVSNSLSTATNAFAVSLTAASNSLAAQITSVNTGLSARIIAASNTLNANIVATSNSMVAQVAAALAKAVTNNGVVINGQALTNGMSLLVGGLATNATLLSLGGTNLPGPLALANSEGVTWLNTATGLAAVVTAAGTFTNLVWNGNANTAQAIVLGESNVVLRYAGGTSYVGMASSITGDLTFNGAINANDNIEIANTKHLRFQDGGGTNTVHLEAVKGRLIITGALDIVSGQAVPATINGSAIATASDVSARLASNVWASAESTTNYALRTTAMTNDSFSINGISVGTGSNIVVSGNGADTNSVGEIASNAVLAATNFIPLTTSSTIYGSRYNKTHGLYTSNFFFTGVFRGPAFTGSNTVGASYTPIISNHVSGSQTIGWFDGAKTWGMVLNASSTSEPFARLDFVTGYGTPATLDSSNIFTAVGFRGDGGGLTNLSAFASLATNGSGNVVTNLTFGGSIITQQMGTVSGGGSGGDVYSSSNNQFEAGTTQRFDIAIGSNLTLRSSGNQFRIMDVGGTARLSVNLTNTSSEAGLQYIFDSPDEQHVAVRRAGIHGFMFSSGFSAADFTFGSDMEGNAGNIWNRSSSSPNYANVGMNLAQRRSDSTHVSWTFVAFSNSFATGHKMMDMTFYRIPNSAQSHGSVTVNSGAGASTGHMNTHFNVLGTGGVFWAFYVDSTSNTTRRARSPRTIITTNTMNVRYTNTFGRAIRVSAQISMTNTTTEMSAFELHTTGNTLLDRAEHRAAATPDEKQDVLHSPIPINVEDWWIITNKSVGAATGSVVTTIFVND